MDRSLTINVSIFRDIQSAQEQQLDCALDLMRRLPPQQIEKNLSDLIDLVSQCTFTILVYTSGMLSSAILCLDIIWESMIL